MVATAAQAACMCLRRRVWDSPIPQQHQCLRHQVLHQIPSMAHPTNRYILPNIIMDRCRPDIYTVHIVEAPGCRRIRRAILPRGSRNCAVRQQNKFDSSNFLACITLISMHLYLVVPCLAGQPSPPPCSLRTSLQNDCLRIVPLSSARLLLITAIYLSAQHFVFVSVQANLPWTVRSALRLILFRLDYCSLVRLIPTLYVPLCSLCSLLCDICSRFHHCTSKSSLFPSYVRYNIPILYQYRNHHPYAVRKCIISHLVEQGLDSLCRTFISSCGVDADSISNTFEIGRAHV